MKDINNSMKETAHTSPYPFKIIKMINGEDVICKIAEEYNDAFVVEYPMSVVKNRATCSEFFFVFGHNAAFYSYASRYYQGGNLSL